MTALPETQTFEPAGIGSVEKADQELCHLVSRLAFETSVFAVAPGLLFFRLGQLLGQSRFALLVLGILGSLDGRYFRLALAFMCGKKEHGGDGQKGQQENGQQKEAGRGGLAVRPFAAAFPRRRRPCVDRRACAVTVQVVGKGLGGQVTFRRVLLQTFETDGFQIDRHFGLQAARRDRILLKDLHNGIHARRRLEWGPAGQKLIKDRSQRVYVRVRTNRVHSSRRLLRGHIARRTDHIAALRLPLGLVKVLGQPEIGDLGEGAGSQETGVRRKRHLVAGRLLGGSFRLLSRGS